MDVTTQSMFHFKAFMGPQNKRQSFLLQLQGVRIQARKQGSSSSSVVVSVHASSADQSQSSISSDVGEENLLLSPVEPPSPTSQNSQDTSPEELQPVTVDPVKLALEKAKAYKKNKDLENGGVTTGVKGSDANTGFKEGEGSVLGNSLMQKSSSKKGKLSISSIDFKGLNFADKKQGKGLPAGLVPVADPFPAVDLPEVEIIVGDTSKFDGATPMVTTPPDEVNADLYKPKVSTWGVFPRPGNISKTFGGGKTIRPGDVLETPEERAAKDERTRQLLAAYRKKVGLSIDPKLKSECDKDLKDGDALMDSGKLNDALPYYQNVMDKLPFQSELHGLAALQWSICQDSLQRSNEARAIYEKLQSHPNAKVSKRARQFMFSFQAMEMMKITGLNFPPKSTGYQDFFEAFGDDMTNYSFAESEIDGASLNQSLPYILLIVSPIFLVFFIAIQRMHVM